ncbi:MAG: hypothetical protein HQM11_10080 [SAR324 cluster bacterium]|nr:hypothetical protein [SAR324 cluster bacterium]
MTKIIRDNFFNITELKEKGFTDTSIKKFLGSCDVEKHNPYNVKYKIKLYGKERVLLVEKSENYKIWKEDAEKRKEKLKQTKIKNSSLIVNDQMKELKELYESIKDEIKSMNIDKKELDELKAISISAYNDYQSDKFYQSDKYDPNFCSEFSDESFLKRIMVNFVRHQQTDYDTFMNVININRRNLTESHSSKLDEWKSVIYKKINEGVYTKISEVYPELNDEIENQMTQKEIDKKTENYFPVLIESKTNLENFF